jgi:uncharacterized repeat protein (TIGR03803 family)
MICMNPQTHLIRLGRFRIGIGVPMPRACGRRLLHALCVSAALLAGVAQADQNSGMDVIHSFGGTDGRLPHDGVIEASDGVLYGTTQWGGSSDGGTVFRLNEDGSDFSVESVPEVAVFRARVESRNARRPGRRVIHNGRGQDCLTPRFWRHCFCRNRGVEPLLASTPLRGAAWAPCAS